MDLICFLVWSTAKIQPRSNLWFSVANSGIFNENLYRQFLQLYTYQTRMHSTVGFAFLTFFYSGTLSLDLLQHKKHSNNFVARSLIPTRHPLLECLLSLSCIWLDVSIVLFSTIEITRLLSISYLSWLESSSSYSWSPRSSLNSLWIRASIAAFKSCGASIILLNFGVDCDLSARTGKIWSMKDELWVLRHAVNISTIWLSWGRVWSKMTCNITPLVHHCMFGCSSETLLGHILGVTYLDRSYPWCYLLWSVVTYLDWWYCCCNLPWSVVSSAEVIVDILDRELDIWREMSSTCRIISEQILEVSDFLRSSRISWLSITCVVILAMKYIT